MGSWRGLGRAPAPRLLGREEGEEAGGAGIEGTRAAHQERKWVGPAVPARGRALSAPPEATGVGPAALPRPASREPRAQQARGLRDPRVSDCPTGCANVADPLIHSRCLGH